MVQSSTRLTVEGEEWYLVYKYYIFRFDIDTF